MRWAKRILLGALGLLAGLGVALGATIAVDAARSPGSAPLTNVRYEAPDGTTLRGYLSVPEGLAADAVAEGATTDRATAGSTVPRSALPAVLLIHEWWGLNEGIVTLADALAREGYVVLAPDAYRGAVTSSVPRALYLRLSTPEEQVKGDLDAALDWLATREAVDAARIASMGFCFGGGHSLQLGLRRSERLAMTLMYYGAVVTEPALLAPLVDAQPVLGVFAEEDTMIFPERVLEFEAALNSLDIENQITIYPDVGHAFVTEENHDDPDTAGGRAWREAVDFLAENL